MKTYLVYKEELQGVADVAETVKTEEKIAASMLGSLRDEVARLSDYSGIVEQTLQRLSDFYMPRTSVLLRAPRRGDRAIVIITGDKGLVGALWHEVIGAFLATAGEYQAVIAFGGKGILYLDEEQQEIARSFAADEAAELSAYVVDQFVRGRFARIDILYPRYVSLASQQPIVATLLPFTFLPVRSAAQTAIGLPIFASSKAGLFDRLLQRYVDVYLRKILHEARLSELSARTVAMEHASLKTDELMRGLRHTFNKERRRFVTQGQLESFTAHSMQQ